MSATAERTGFVDESLPLPADLRIYEAHGDNVDPSITADIVFGQIDKLARMPKNRSGTSMNVMVPVTLGSGESAELNPDDVKIVENTEVDGLALAHYIRFDKKTGFIIGTAFISVVAVSGVVAAHQKRPRHKT